MQLLLHGEQLRVTELFFIPDGVQLPENAFPPRQDEAFAKRWPHTKTGMENGAFPMKRRQGRSACTLRTGQKCRKEASACNDTINDVFMMHNHNRNSLEARLKARVCELCGTTQGELFELHHVRKVKDLNGKERWEQCMIAKRRKTLVVCKPCHNAIHHGSKSQ